MTEKINDWIGEQMSDGEPAKRFSPETHVWSEMAVRSAIIRALHNYERRQDGAEEVDHD